MRGHSTTASLPRTPHRFGLSALSVTQKFGARPGRAGLAIAGLGAALALAACGSGYGPYGPYGLGKPQPGGASDDSGRLAISWTLNDAPLTQERCQAERIDSMAVQVVSEIDGISSVEFISVVYALSRYSMERVPSGPVSVYLGTVHTRNDQGGCVRYAAIGHATATTQYAATPFPVELLAVTNCP